MGKVPRQPGGGVGSIPPGKRNQKLCRHKEAQHHMREAFSFCLFSAMLRERAMQTFFINKHVYTHLFHSENNPNKFRNKRKEILISQVWPNTF